MKPRLANLWKASQVAIDPVALLRSPQQEKPGTGAALFWGKAALRTARAWGASRSPVLIISPSGEKGTWTPPSGTIWIQGEHPWPGDGSFRAGVALLEFFDLLRRERIRRLTVFLSGGASSLAWLKPASFSRSRLLGELHDLYRQPLTIEELNQARSRLCRLKSGGAAFWLRELAPEVHVEVELISDVLPYGPEVVGSGPFWDGKIRHRILADNQTLVDAIAREAERRGQRVLRKEAGKLGDWKEWATQIRKAVLEFVDRGASGLLILGGEPQIHLSSKEGRGGRMSQVGARLLFELTDLLSSGRVEILCASSDGVDGRSGSSATWLNSRVASPFLQSARRHALKTAILHQDTAGVLRNAGALLPERGTGTNVQDVILVSIQE